MPLRSAPPKAEVEAARADLETATDILFRAWGSWYRAPPQEADRAKLAVEAAEKRYRDAQHHLDEIAGEPTNDAR